MHTLGSKLPVGVKNDMVDKSARILLVDDEQSIQTLLSYPLRKDGYDVVRAADGREALDRFAEQAFDLVVLDLMLPQVDGLEVCRRLRARSAVKTTYVEFEILSALARAPGRVFTRDMLLERVWGDAAYRDPRTIDVHIRHLREKLERDAKEPEYIFTVRGVGYRFRDEER